MAQKKKLKKLSRKTSKNEVQEFTTAIRDSATQIWLAGLGAFAKAQEEGNKIFENLVKQGADIENQTRKVTTAQVHEVKDVVEGSVKQARERASEGLGKLEKVFEERVAKALHALGVPTAADVQELTRRVEELQKTVAGTKKPVAVKKATVRKTPAKKTTKKVAKKKTAKKKASKATVKKTAK